MRIAKTSGLIILLEKKRNVEEILCEIHRMKEEFLIVLNASEISLRKIIHKIAVEHKRHAKMHFVEFMKVFLTTSKNFSAFLNLPQLKGNKNYKQKLFKNYS